MCIDSRRVGAVPHEVCRSTANMVLHTVVGGQLAHLTKLQFFISGQNGQNGKTIDLRRGVTSGLVTHVFYLIEAHCRNSVPWELSIGLA